MHDQDKEILIERNSKRLEKFGFSKAGLGWGKLPQDVRFSALINPLYRTGGESILDVGCGFADLYDYLIKIGWNGNYMGIDISPDMVKITKEKKPNLDIRKLDLLEESIEEEFDIVLACGIFNLKLTKSDNYEYIHKMLERMFKIAKIGISVDFLSILADYQAEEAFHPEFADILSIASKISKRFSMFHNYSPYEFSLILYKNQNIQNDLAFQK